MTLLAMLPLVWPVSAQAQFDDQTQTAVPTLIFQPHCEEADQMLCPQFDVADPTTLMTPQYAVGDTLDLDVVLINPTQEQINKVRMWISYDSEALEGTKITVSPAFPTIAPGQADFSALSGYAKITASAAAGSEPADMYIPIARLTFTVKNTANSIETPLTFYDQRKGIDGHTFVTTSKAPQQNLVSKPLGALLVEFVGPGQPTQQLPLEGNSPGMENPLAPNALAAPATFDPYAPSAVSSASMEPAPFADPSAPSSVSADPNPYGQPSLDGTPAVAVDGASAPSSTGGPPAPPDLNALLGLPPLPDPTLPSADGYADGNLAAQLTPGGTDSFGLIQIQNVHVGTKDNTLYVTWDALSHPKLQGYNVYYGTMRGRYLNRHSVSVASRGAVIHDLPTGKTYFVAVRGVDDINQETAFSAEASVEIGNPSTSSSPIVGTLDLVADVAPGTNAPENPVVHMNETQVQGSAVPGKSGAPSGFVLLLVGSAAIGTLFACRRQMIASRRIHA